MAIVIDREKCKKKLPCGICVDVCPQDIFVMTADGPETLPLSLRFSMLKG